MDESVVLAQLQDARPWGTATYSSSRAGSAAMIFTSGRARWGDLQVDKPPTDTQPRWSPRRFPDNGSDMTLWSTMPSKDHPSHLDHPATKPGLQSVPRTERFEIRRMHNRTKNQRGTNRVINNQHRTL
jgi:hypothetical protein